MTSWPAPSDADERDSPPDGCQPNGIEPDGVRPGSPRGRSWRSSANRERRLGQRPARPTPAPIDVALRFLAARPRSEREIRLRLSRAGVEEPDVERVLGQLRQLGLADDAAFARYWVDQRQTFRPRGSRLLQAELRQRGVSSALASEAAETLADDAYESAYRAASKRAMQLRACDEQTFKHRLSGYLQRRGFNWDTVAPTVTRLWSETQPG